MSGVARPIANVYDARVTEKSPESARADSQRAERRVSRPSLSSVAGRERPPRQKLVAEPKPGSAPGTLVSRGGAPPEIYLVDYDKDVIVERKLDTIGDCLPFLEDDRPSITWIDIRGIGGDTALFERLGRILSIHPLALEDIVNAPQRPKSDAYKDQHLIISRMVQLTPAGTLKTEQIGVLFGKSFVVTVQESADADVLDPVRERLRKGRGAIRTGGADYLAYAIVDAVIDAFYPVLERFGERLEELELEASSAAHGMSRAIHGVKRELLTVRRAIWPQRDLLNALLREESPLIAKETRIYLRDTYDHAVQIMDMVETFREIASGLMDLYLSGVSTRMNEIMKVLTILSTIFLPITAIGGIYGMNFNPEASRYNMPELSYRYGYPAVLVVMTLSVVFLLVFYWRKGWIGARFEVMEAAPPADPDAPRG